MSRERIVSIDEQIIDLLLERREVSQGIQDERVRNGGSRIDVSRERQIIEQFRSRLGRSGSEIAWALLHLCRGAS